MATPTRVKAEKAKTSLLKRENQSYPSPKKQMPQTKKSEKQAKPANTSKSGNDHVSPYLAKMSSAAPGLLIVNTTDRSLLMGVRAVFEYL